MYAMNKYAKMQLLNLTAQLQIASTSDPNVSTVRQQPFVEINSETLILTILKSTYIGYIVSLNLIHSYKCNMNAGGVTNISISFL